MGKLTGKAALITGAGAGLGAGISEAFAKHGAKLCLVDRADTVEQTAARLRQTYAGLEVITCMADVTNVEDLKAAAGKAAEAFGGLDIACCNAGVCKLANFLEMGDDIRDFHINVNIKGVWNTCKAAIPYMLDAGKGSIVIASSVTGDIVADPGESAYALSKAALVGLTKALAVEYAPKGIRVNCTQLGYARTPMSESIAKDSNSTNLDSSFVDMAKGIPMGRLANPTEVGELTAFLASDEASYITGAQVVIDGGSTLPESNMGV